MEVKKFDVVELKNGNRATILDIKNNKYCIEEVDSKGVSLGNKEISDSDINNVVFAKK